MQIYCSKCGFITKHRSSCLGHRCNGCGTIEEDTTIGVPVKPTVFIQAETKKVGLVSYLQKKFGL